MSGHSSRVKMRRRADVWFAIGSVAALVLLAWVVITMEELSHDLRTANDARDLLAKQVQSLGHTPVAGPPGSRGEAGQSVIGPRGPKGAKGDTGASGRPAPTITPSPGPAGASGAPGKDGADSTVPGPTGPPGADSTVAGPSGAPGAQGEKGEPGSPGSPPAGWTFTYNGVKYTCKPVADFDESNPQYDCESDQPGPSPGPSPTQQNLALDPNRRRAH